MSQIYTSVSSTPSVPTEFVTDDGSAIPAANILNVLGGQGIETEGSGDTITINLTGVANNYVNVTNAMSPYEVTADDYFISCNSSTGAITIQLPNSPSLYDQFVVKDRTGNASTNTITVTTVGGAILIDGDTSVEFVDDYESLELLWNGTSYESF